MTPLEIRLEFSDEDEMDYTIETVVLSENGRRLCIEIRRKRKIKKVE